MGAWTLGGIAFLAGLVAARWVLELDQIVVDRFEGPRFAVPSKVLSAPTILYPGLDWQRADLLGSLRRLGYRERAAGAPLSPGSFRKSGGSLEVYLRAFDHPSRPEPARDVVISLDGAEIREIRERGTGREVVAALLEPELVGAYYGLDHEQRELVRFEELPPHLVHAVVAVEDQRFGSHLGIDPWRILGAFAANLRAGGIRQGGSTLTQQLVKNFFLTPEQTLRRKAQEAVMAILVEARYDKSEIFEAYLNEIYLGQRGSTAVHGMGEAAHFYFGKRAADLTLSEAALLAAIIQSPNRISPHRHPERAKQRRDLVLDLMARQGRIGDAELARAKSEPVRVADITRDAGDARFFLDLLRRQLPEAYGPETLRAEGLQIYSTLDPRLQRAAAEALREGLDAIDATLPQKDRGLLQGCIVVLRPQTGEVLALVGGRNYARSQFDRCTLARRQVGSVFKPFVYLAALEPRGDAFGRAKTPLLTLASFVDDTPFVLETPAGTWSPENFDKRFRGRIPVRQALELSLNTPAARLGAELGVDRVIEVARRLGITSPLPAVPSLALGTAELSPLEVARAYATLASGGIRATPHTFEDVVDDGRTLERRTLGLERVIDPGSAFLVTQLLEGVVDRGTAKSLRSRGLRGPIAGKTGTTDEEHDLWFVGFTPEWVAAVWVGFDEPKPVGMTSTRGALPIWARFATEAVGPEIRGSFAPPPEIRVLPIEPSTGALALAGCESRRSEYFLPGTEPTTVCGKRPRRSSRAEGERSWFDWIVDHL